MALSVMEGNQEDAVLFNDDSLDFTFEEEIADSLQQNMAMETPLKKRKAD